MNAMFNRKILRLFPIIFLVIILIRILYDYNNLLSNESGFAKKEAEVLNSYAMAHREYYQKLFIDKTIPLDENTLKGLPAYSSLDISKKFSKDNSLNITIRTVSDRARNHLNDADTDELKAINFFQNNKDKAEYFSGENKNYYQYASALVIDNKCLLCHGNKEDAPIFIRENYSDAYDYKLGDIRGILSIKIPTKSVRNYFFRNFIESVIYDIILLIALFFGISYIVKKSKTINTMLEKEVREKTSELRDMLVIDKLTNLPNRRQLIEDIQKYAASTSRHLALLNIDTFKDTNDFYGHSAGDKILKDLANSLVRFCINEENKIYKLPSDEFAVFSTIDEPQVEFIASLQYVIANIHKTEFVIDNNKIFIILSCGVASNENDLMTTADMALQTAKDKNTSMVVYDDSLDISSKVIENTKKITLLRDAITHNNIVPFFQPIYNIHTQKIEKYECLVRIVQDDGTIILPYQFLDVAIKSKQYLFITKIMIAKSFDFFRDKDYEFSINLSIVDVTSDEMLNFIIENLEKFSEPQRVVFEILENEKLGNYQEMKKFIKTIKKFGCKFAIDDFGSGYSNFAHIYELNIDYIKIDASLVKYITTDENSRIITKTIINFASNLGLKTIAEFVEDKESLDMLQKMGADYIQGYYIGKPEADLNTTF
jgi:c-di-GMP phosphodiesterase